jgi:hypothetical protein
MGCSRMGKGGTLWGIVGMNPGAIEFIRSSNQKADIASFSRYLRPVEMRRHPTSE